MSLIAALAAVGCEASSLEQGFESERAGPPPLVTTVELDTTLATGDAAKVFAPKVNHGLQIAFEDEFPVVVLLQGGLTSYTQYTEYASALASYGYVVIVPERLRSFPPIFNEPVPLTDSIALTAALDHVAELDADPSSPIYKIADTDTAALTGHSQGGAVSLLAIGGLCIPGLCTPPFELPESVQAAALFGTNLVSGASVTDIDSSGISVALLQGELDGRALPEQAEQTYEILEPRRALIQFEGLNHFGITNDNQIPGTNQDPKVQTVDQQEGIERLALWTARWLNAELRGSQAAENWLFKRSGSVDGSVTVISD